MNWESSIAWGVVILAVATALICRRLGRGPSLDGMVRYLILMRVPLLTLAGLMGLPWVLADTRLVGNIFVLSNPLDLAVVAAVAVVATSSCILTARLIARLARFRYHVSHTPLRRFLHVSAIASGSPGHVLLANFTATPLLAILSREAEDGSTALFALIGGMCIGTIVTLGADALLRWVFGYQWSEDVVLSSEEPDKKDWLWDGYRLPARTGLFGAHYAALSSLLLLVGMFIAGIAYLGPGEPFHEHVPPLTYLLFLAALVNTSLSGITFFFDRFRIPLIGILLVAKMLAFPFASDSEHVFEVEAVSDRLRPESVGEIVGRLRAAAPADDGAVIIVCTAGGGIQAAAWTAHVLTTLDHAVPDFRRRVGLISGVSGGSVGAMFYVEALRRAAATARSNDLPDFRLDPHELEAVFEASTRSSLSAIGWSIVFRDLPRLMSFTPRTFRDRGWAMEQVWSRSLPAGGRLEATLRDWIEATRRGDIPPVALNATIAASRNPDDVGRRLVFSTVDFSDAGDSQDVPLEFHDGFPSNAPADERSYFDIAMVTAARMSATFPYVSPIAGAATRTADDEPDDLRLLRLADGGYFDNFGVATALNWIREARATEGAPSFKRVALVCIEPFPPPAADAGSGSGPTRHLEPAWHDAASAPIALLLDAWDAAQRVRGTLEQDIVERWLDEAQHPAAAPDAPAPPSRDVVRIFRFRPPRAIGAVKISPSTTRFPDRARSRLGIGAPHPDFETVEPPLSWHLTDAEVDRVVAGWERGNEERLQALLSWLGH